MVWPDNLRAETGISRINEFLNSGGHQVEQAKVAIAQGGLFGEGPGNSTQRNHLPYAYADCIYAIICEEYGIVGGFVVLGLYLWLLIRCVKLVVMSPISLRSNTCNGALFRYCHSSFCKYFSICSIGTGNWSDPTYDKYGWYVIYIYMCLLWNYIERIKTY